MNLVLPYPSCYLRPLKVPRWSWEAQALCCSQTYKGLSRTLQKYYIFVFLFKFSLKNLLYLPEQAQKLPLLTTNGVFPFSPTCFGPRYRIFGASDCHSCPWSRSTRIWLLFVITDMIITFFRIYVGSPSIGVSFYQPQHGDTCVKIVDLHPDLNLTQFFQWNPEIHKNCDNLPDYKPVCLRPLLAMDCAWLFETGSTWYGEARVWLYGFTAVLSLTGWLEHEYLESGNISFLLRSWINFSRLIVRSLLHRAVQLRNGLTRYGRPRNEKN